MYFLTITGDLVFSYISSLQFQNFSSSPERKSLSLTSSRVLVLNQSYEPVTICSTRKAMILLFLAKAIMVEAKDGNTIHTVSHSFPFPSVIRLANYIRVPYKNIELSRKNILRRDGMTCQYCGTKSPELTVDHIIPKSHGGQDSWENMVAACRECNNKKGNHSPEEVSLKLLSKPKKPNHIVFIQQSTGNVEDNWRRFLFMD